MESFARGSEGARNLCLKKFEGRILKYKAMSKKKTSHGNKEFLPCPAARLVPKPHKAKPRVREALIRVQHSSEREMLCKRRRSQR